MEGPPAKKPRLSLACNECRRRKVRCDASYPRCKNCSTRDIDCFTSDPKHPGLSVVREWIDGNNAITSTGANAGKGSADAHVRSPSASGQSKKSASLMAADTGRAPSQVADHAQETNATVSPAYQPHQMFFNVSSNKMKMMGGSSSACLTQSLNLYLKRAGIKTVSEHFRHGMAHAEEHALPLSIDLPDFPPEGTRCRYMDAFFERIHRLWPMFDIDQTRATIHQLASISDRRRLSPDQVPLLASAYLILSLGADEDARHPVEDGTTFLNAAASLWAHIITMPYLSSVQALLLLAITYRGRNKDGLGWQSVGMAVRIAQTLGLHKHSVVKPSQEHAVTRKVEKLFHARIWAICCCLEKVMQLESGRPSAIGHIDRDQMMGQEQRPPGLDFLQWNMGIAEFQAHISEHIYGHRPGDRTARQILLDTARLDKALLDWSNELPPDFHPVNDLYCADEDFHIAAQLAVQYHAAMIALHRAGLIAPTQHFEQEINEQCPDDPLRFRLKGGELICVKSARAIARLTIELADRRTDSRILNGGPALLACIVLAIYQVKQPNSRMQTTDLELLKTCAEHVRDHFLRTGNDPRFAQGSIVIYDAVRQYVEIVRGGQSSKPQLVGSQPQNTSSQSRVTNAVENDAGNAILLSSDSITASRADPPAYQDIAGGYPLLSSSNSSAFPEPKWTGSHSENNSVMPPPPSTNGKLTSYERMAPDTNQPALQNQGFIDDGFDIGPLPFDDYNVEELWNWMLLVDSSQSPLDSLSGSHNYTTMI